MDDITRPAPKLTKYQAFRAYTAVCAKYDETAHPAAVTHDGGTWPTGPVLVRGFESAHGGDYAWAVVWEGGPHEWPVECGYGADGKPDYPAGVWTEAINGYALALYPV